MTEEELGQLRDAVIQLGKLVQTYVSVKYYLPQLKQLSWMLECIDSDVDPDEKTEFLVQSYRNLFRPKCGLSEFYIHDDDFETRRRLNEPLDKAVNTMREILKPYMDK